MQPFKLSRRTAILDRLPLPMIVVALALAVVGGFAIHWGVGLLILAYILRLSAESVWETARSAAEFEWEAYQMARLQFEAFHADNELIDPRRV